MHGLTYIRYANATKAERDQMDKDHDEYVLHHCKQALRAKQRRESLYVLACAVVTFVTFAIFGLNMGE